MLRKIINVQTGEETLDYDYVPPPPPPPPTAEEREEEVQSLSRDLLEVSDINVAMAQATVRLVLAAVKGQIPAGATEAQVLQRYRDEVLAILRQRKGI